MRNPWLRKSAVGFEDGRRKPRRIEGCNCLKSMVCRCPVPPYRDGGRFRLPPSWGSFAGNGAADGLCLVVESGSMACRIGKTASRPEYCGRFGDRLREEFVSSGLASTCFRGTSGRLPERACVFGHFVVGPLLTVSRAAVRTADGIRWALRWAGPGSGRGLYRPGSHPPVSGGLPVVCRSARVSPAISSSGRCLRSVGPRCVLPTEYDGRSGGRDPAPGGGLYRPGPYSLAFGRFRRLPVGCRNRKKVPDRNRIPFSFSERCVYRCTVFLMSFTLS